MAFTRFNYDECRTKKKLQESTGPGRYALNMPGNGTSPCFFNDPQIRMQKWGANLDNVINGAPIDIDSDLKGVTRKLTKYNQKSKFPNSGVPITPREINIIKGMFSYDKISIRQYKLIEDIKSTVSRRVKL